MCVFITKAIAKGVVSFLSTGALFMMTQETEFLKAQQQFSSDCVTSCDKLAARLAVGRNRTAGDAELMRLAWSFSRAMWNVREAETQVRR